MTFVWQVKWRLLRVNVVVTQTNILTEAVRQPGGGGGTGPVSDPRTRSFLLGGVRQSVTQDHINTAFPGMSPSFGGSAGGEVLEIFPPVHVLPRGGGGGHGASLQDGWNSTPA